MTYYSVMNLAYMWRDFWYHQEPSSLQFIYNYSYLWISEHFADLLLLCNITKTIQLDTTLIEVPEFHLWISEDFPIFYLCAKSLKLVSWISLCNVCNIARMIKLDIKIIEHSLLPFINIWTFHLSSIFLQFSQNHWINQYNKIKSYSWLQLGMQWYDSLLKFDICTYIINKKTYNKNKYILYIVEDLSYSNFFHI